MMRIVGNITELGKSYIIRSLLGFDPICKLLLKEDSSGTDNPTFLYDQKVGNAIIFDPVTDTYRFDDLLLCDFSDAVVSVSLEKHSSYVERVISVVFAPFSKFDSYVSTIRTSQDSVVIDDGYFGQDISKKIKQVELRFRINSGKFDGVTVPDSAADMISKIILGRETVRDVRVFLGRNDDELDPSVDTLADPNPFSIPIRENMLSVMPDGRFRIFHKTAKSLISSYSIKEMGLGYVLPDGGYKLFAREVFNNPPPARSTISQTDDPLFVLDKSDELHSLLYVDHMSALSRVQINYYLDIDCVINVTI